MPAVEITIRPATGKWVVRAAGAILGESRNALELTEGDRPPVIYFPREDVAMALLDGSPQTTTCPFKGLASYYSIQSKSRTLENAVWSYQDPIAAVIEIKDHLAFDPLQVTVERI